jgi:hypothetical protein
VQVDDAATLGLPLWVGEFGGDPSTDAHVLTTHYAQQESRGISGTVWVWEEHGAWSIASPARATLVSRAYPVATAGTLLSAVSNPAAGTAELRATSPRVRPSEREHATLLRLPLPFNGSRIRVSGARFETTEAAGGRDVWVFPTGGDYRVVVAR